MFVVTAILTVKANHLDEFMQRLEAHVSLSLKEGRCRAFTISKSTDNPNKLFYHEAYDDKKLFDEHINSPRVQAHIQNTSSMIDGDLWFAEWNTVSDQW